MSQATNGCNCSVRVVCEQCGSARVVDEDENPEQIVEDHRALGCAGAEIEEVDPDE